MKRILGIFFSIAFVLGTKAQPIKDVTAYLNESHKKYSEKIEKMVELIRKDDSIGFFSLRNECIALAKKNNNDPYLSSYCFEKLAVWKYYHGDIKGAIPYFDSALAITTKYKLDKLSGANYMNKGSSYYTLRDYTKALYFYKTSEEILLKEGSESISTLLGNIALLYQEIGELENAKRYLNRSLPLVKLRGERDGYAKALNNLALIYKKEGKYKDADSVFLMGYNITKEYGLKNDYADITYNRVNLLSDDMHRFKEARELNEELLAFVEKNKDASWKKQVQQNMAHICFELHDVAAAKKYLMESEKIAIKDEDMDEDDINSILTSAKLYHDLGMYDRSSDGYVRYWKLSEGGEKEKELQNVTQLSYKYEKRQDSITNAKEREITELENKNEQEKAENQLKRQRIVIIVSLAGLVFIIIFLFFLIKANRNKEKANKEISYQKSLLAEKNKEITDSITYAQRIQQSLLPPAELMEILLPKHFLVYLPKDIVSGDFYWVKKLNANELFVAVADCTGHGVPGAMMSALSIQNLNELSGQTRSPGELLSLLNTNLRNTLNQDQVGFSKDGLDICLCKVNIKEHKVHYSGANRSLMVFDEKGLKYEIKATKNGIGGHTQATQVYEEHELTLQDNDMIVMSTDGFADQFGGKQGRKLTTKRFKEWMTSIISENDKKVELTRKFVVWKGLNDQIDDVCVLGFKI